MILASHAISQWQMCQISPSVMPCLWAELHISKIQCWFCRGQCTIDVIFWAVIYMRNAVSSSRSSIWRINFPDEDVWCSSLECIVAGSETGRIMYRKVCIIVFSVKLWWLKSWIVVNCQICPFFPVEQHRNCSYLAVQSYVSYSILIARYRPPANEMRSMHIWSSRSSTRAITGITHGCVLDCMLIMTSPVS